MPKEISAEALLTVIAALITITQSMIELTALSEVDESKWASIEELELKRQDLLPALAVSGINPETVPELMPAFQKLLQLDKTLSENISAEKQLLFSAIKRIRQVQNYGQ